MPSASVSSQDLRHSTAYSSQVPTRGRGEIGLGAPRQEADNVGVQALLFAFSFQSQFSV